MEKVNLRRRVSKVNDNPREKREIDFSERPYTCRLVLTVNKDKVT